MREYDDDELKLDS